MANKHCHVVDGKNIKIVELFFGLLKDWLVGIICISLNTWKKKIYVFSLSTLSALLLYKRYIIYFCLTWNRVTLNKTCLALLELFKSIIDRKKSKQHCIFSTTKCESILLLCSLKSGRDCIMWMEMWICHFHRFPQFLGFFYFCFCLFYFLVASNPWNYIYNSTHPPPDPKNICLYVTFCFMKTEKHRLNKNNVNNEPRSISKNTNRFRTPQQMEG